MEGGCRATGKKSLNMINCDTFLHSMETLCSTLMESHCWTLMQLVAMIMTGSAHVRSALKQSTASHRAETRAIRVTRQSKASQV